MYEAVDRDTNRRVALKILRRLDPYLLVRFKNEFRALQNVRHPNLVRLGELIEDHGSWAFTMELIEGVDFLTYVGVDPSDMDVYPAENEAEGEVNKFDEARLRSGLIQLSRGLIALHDAGKVHRDIKPTNILIGPDDRLVLLDFGFVAGQEGDPDLEPGWTVGTPDYMAPEQARGDVPGAPADWYSAGTLMYRAMTNELPFRGDATTILQDKQYIEPPPASRRVPGIAPDLDQICAGLLRTEPELRPDGREVLDKLGARAANERISGRIATPPDPDAGDLFVGRRAELASLRQHFDAVTEGASSIVSIRGESGVGKSALARRFVDSIADEEIDVLTLVGHCYERESVPYKAIDELVDAISRRLLAASESYVEALLPEDAPLIARVFPVLRRLPAFGRLARQTDGAIEPVALRARLFRALRSLFQQLSKDGRVVVLIEDMQWADDDSRDLLRALMAAPAPPILIITTERSHGVDGEPRAPVFARAQTIELGALSDEESQELAEKLFPAAEAASSDERRAIADHAKGHPMFIAELVRASVAHADGAETMDLNDLVWAPGGRPRCRSAADHRVGRRGGRARAARSHRPRVRHSVRRLRRAGVVDARGELGSHQRRTSRGFDCAVSRSDSGGGIDAARDIAPGWLPRSGRPGVRSNGAS